MLVWFNLNMDAYGLCMYSLRSSNRLGNPGGSRPDVLYSDYVGALVDIIINCHLNSHNIVII